MISVNSQFKLAADQSGISSLGLNLKSFLFQLATFVIVLLILRRWVFPKLILTLEARRRTLEESLVHAKQTQEALERAEEKSAELLHKARVQADVALSEASERAKLVIAKAEEAAEAQAQRVLAEAQAELAQQKNKLRDELKAELGNLVVETTEKVLRQKLTAKADMELIKRSVKELE